MSYREFHLFGGTFGHLGGDNGKPSGYIRKLSDELSKYADLTVTNGGNYDALYSAALAVPDDAILLWFPNISNDVDKLLPLIRSNRPNLTIAISKNNLEGKYTAQDLRERRLAADAACLVEFTKGDSGFIVNLHYEDSVIAGFLTPEHVAQELVSI